MSMAAAAAAIKSVCNTCDSRPRIALHQRHSPHLRVRFNHQKLFSLRAIKRFFGL
jgi:hypothetical protein